MRLLSKLAVIHGVIPAKAGTSVCGARSHTEIPAFAGMTRWVSAASVQSSPSHLWGGIKGGGRLAPADLESLHA